MRTFAAMESHNALRAEAQHSADCELAEQLDEQAGDVFDSADVELLGELIAEHADPEAVDKLFWMLRRHYRELPQSVASAWDDVRESVVECLSADMAAALAKGQR